MRAPVDRAVEADLVVIGGGPVGLGTAIEARLAGLSVAVVEPRGPVVDKACGEGLMPSARAGLERLGVAPTGVPLRGIHYLSPAASAVAAFGDGPGLGVRRTELSSALWHRAQEVGVVHVPARAAPPRPVPGGVLVDCDPRSMAVPRDAVPGDAVPGDAVPGDAVPGDAVPARVSARWAVAADGLHSPVRRALGLDAPARGAIRYGLRRHAGLAPWTDLVEVHWAADAEAYVTPVAADTVGVAILGPGGAPFETWLERFPALSARLAGAPWVSATRGAGPLRQRAAARVAGPVLLAGDAAGYVDALTGEGIAVGLSCARALVGCLVRGRPQDYERAWWRATRRYRFLTGGLLAATGRPWSRRALVPAAQRVPWLFSGIVNQLGR